VILAAHPRTLRQHAIRTSLGETLASQRSDKGSDAAVHETRDHAAKAEPAVGPSVGVVIELGRCACCVGPEIHSGIPHPPNAIASVAGDVAGRDFGLGVSVSDDPMAAIVLNGIREDLSGGASVNLNTLRAIALNRVRRADPIVGRAHPPIRALEFDWIVIPAKGLFWIVLLMMSAELFLNTPIPFLSAY